MNSIFSAPMKPLDLLQSFNKATYYVKAIQELNRPYGMKHM